jgi:two-component system osmolarity sensor histidine kinase EnvZ
LEVVNLREVLDLSSQPLIPSGQLALNVSMATSIEVKADPVELRRVFNNLLENAIRYGKNKEGMAVVEITGAVQGNSVTVQVRDHGPGVKPEQIGRLTEPFYRSDEARTAASGSGLGLAIVSKTVSRMGGELKLSNHTEGGLVATMKLQKA